MTRRNGVRRGVLPYRCSETAGPGFGSIVVREARQATDAGPDVRPLFVRADVCRDDLPIEIEAGAGHPPEPLS